MIPKVSLNLSWTRLSQSNPNNWTLSARRFYTVRANLDGSKPLSFIHFVNRSAIVPETVAINIWELETMFWWHSNSKFVIRRVLWIWVSEEWYRMQSAARINCRLDCVLMKTIDFLLSRLVIFMKKSFCFVFLDFLCALNALKAFS